MKKEYKLAICIRNDQGFERVLIVGKEYKILKKTNRYVTIQTEIGNIQSVWKGYFKLI